MIASKKPLAFLDTETTGLVHSEHEIIEIAIIRDNPDGTQQKFHTRIKPKHLERASPKALEINGYVNNPSLWDDAPVFELVAEDIANLLRGAYLVGHNVPFDAGILKVEFERAGMKPDIHYQTLDTMALVHEHLVPCGLPYIGLNTVRPFLGWSTAGAHTALQDTEDTRRLYYLLRRATVFHRAWWWFNGLKFIGAIAK